MSISKFDYIFKVLCYVAIPISLYFFVSPYFMYSSSSIENESTFNISSENQILNNNFVSLFEDSIEVNSSSQKELLFKDLGVELVGIVSMKDFPERGYIILNFLDKKENKNIFRPGDKIDNNVFLESIYSNFIRVSISNKIFQIYLSDKKVVTEVDGIINLDVSLLEILPYLKIEKGAINGTLGIYISDRVEGKILRKLHLKETDLLFNLNGYNVFNLATLNDAYRKLEDKKEIVASIYRNGKIKKIIARRIDAL